MKQFFNCWTTNVKLTWNLPRNTRSYFIQCLAAGFIPARAEILTRTVGFFKSLRKAPRHEVVTVALLASRDLRSTLGRNLRLVEEETKLDPWRDSTVRVRETLATHSTTPTPTSEEWRVKYFHKLLERRQQYRYWGMEEVESATQQLLESICINWLCFTYFISRHNDPIT